MASRPRRSSLAGLETVEFETGGGTERDTLPTVVAIHGMGDAPENWVPQWSQVPFRARIVLPRAPLSYGDGYSWFPYSFSTTDPKARAVRLENGTRDGGTRVGKLIEALKTERPTRGRPIVTGFSQGGMISQYVATIMPNAIALAVPMGGLLPPALYPKSRWVSAGDAGGVPLRVLALHGTEDAVVPFASDEAGIRELARLGWNAELVHYPVGHTVSSAMRQAAESAIRDAVAREQSAELH